MPIFSKAILNLTGVISLFTQHLYAVWVTPINTFLFLSQKYSSELKFGFKNSKEENQLIQRKEVTNIPKYMKQKNHGVFQK